KITLQPQASIISPQVAFSVSLADSGELYKGPCADKTLVFKRVFSNIGNGYNPNTGMFTAPVGGAYFFTFNTFGYNSHTAGAILIKNNDIQGVSADGADSSSNSVLLSLAPGDTLHLQLWDNGQVFDNANAHTTFTGFLLHPTTK
uniref:C1q domain-containing protein n=1 Tax=Periophthalmus magnuspinnatus TaxID=409849 RepID=A0A3B3ZL85_9GOBI